MHKLFRARYDIVTVHRGAVWDGRGWLIVRRVGKELGVLRPDRKKMAQLDQNMLMKI